MVVWVFFIFWDVNVVKELNWWVSCVVCFFVCRGGFLCCVVDDLVGDGDIGFEIGEVSVGNRDICYGLGMFGFLFIDCYLWLLWVGNWVVEWSN